MTITSDRPTLLVEAPAGHAAERQYILDLVLGEWLGLDHELIVGAGDGCTVRLAGDPGGRELTLPDVLFATGPDDWLTERSQPARPLPRLTIEAFPSAGAGAGGTEATIPAIFGEPGHGGQAWRRTERGLALAVDIFGSAFHQLTRYEEVVDRTSDLHGRFPATASLAAAEGFLHRPIVDEYVDLLWAAIHDLWPSLTRPETAFRLRLSHDIDQPWAAFGQSTRSVAQALAGDVVRRRDLALGARRLRAVLDARRGRTDRDPYNTFEFLMATSERHGLRSTFYFMAGNQPSDFDFRYRLDDPEFRPILREVHRRGHEIGLHASYVSFGSAERIRAEFEALKRACLAAGVDQPAWGVRQHYLRFETSTTWVHHEAAGLAHDSTLGYADEIGFRAGTCREFPLFDLVGRCRLRLRERPLVVMDATLFGYRALDLDQAAERIRSIVETCRRHRGDAVVLYHNNAIPGRREQAHYTELVAELVRAT